jgi:cytochrome P450
MFFDLADAMIDDFLTRSSFNAVGNFAEVFPTAVFPKAFGMTDVNKRHLVDYRAMVFNSLGPDNDIRKATMVKAAEIIPWINAACARKRLTHDSMGAILYDAADAGEITHEEARFLVRSFLSTGVDTAISSIGNAMVYLVQHPGEFEKLKAYPALARPCFEEVLRYTSPSWPKNWNNGVPLNTGM